MVRILSVLILAVSILLAGGSTSAILAQDNELEASLIADPELCTLDPRTIDEIETLLADPAFDDIDPPTPVSDPFEMPEGYSLFENERTEIEKDLLRAVACFNTGNPLKVFSTYTDRHVVALVEDLGGLTPDVVSALESNRTIEPADYVTILDFGESVLLEDGRIAVLVFGDDLSDDDPPGRRLFLLEEVLPGRWLIDEVIEIDG